MLVNKINLTQEQIQKAGNARCLNYVQQQALKVETWQAPEHYGEPRE
jgi:hypothetical protein